MRTPEDLLREEYFELLPHVRRATEELEAEVRHQLIPLSRTLQSHERLVVRSRVKECESAIGALMRRTELFDHSRESLAPSLTALNDLAGVRVLAFPKFRVLEADELLQERFPTWAADPVPAAPFSANSLALKYHGYCGPHSRVRGEIQIMSMLIGLFWEVEHAALYKPGASLRGLEISTRMRERNADVIHALRSFETEFESFACATPPRTSAPSAAAQSRTPAHSRSPDSSASG